MSDKISIYGITARGFHGVLESERLNGQEFMVDVELHVDLKAAGQHDDLTLTVDYASVAQTVDAIIIGKPFKLIEALAEKIASEILLHQLVNEVKVTVHKPSAPIPVPFSDVTVSIKRSN
jgi:dihydroneopterin aldolase